MFHAAFAASPPRALRRAMARSGPARPPRALRRAMMKSGRGRPEDYEAMTRGGRGRPEDFDVRFGGREHFGGPPFGGPHFGFGPGFGFGPPFGGGRGRSRKRRGDVRVALLLLLAEEPRNGYQLMQSIEERSGGRWRPSPGSVYPALQQLEDEGLIRPVDRDGTKLFEITDAGRAQLAEREAERPPWEEFADDPEFQTFSDLRSLLKQVHIAAIQVGQAGDEKQIEQATQLLSETRRSLYRILAEESDA